MDEKYTFALRKIALLGGIDDLIAISSRELGDALNMSQQSASKRILELLDEKLITRDLGARKQRIKLTERGVDALKEEYNEYRRIFELEDDIFIPAVRRLEQKLKQSDVTAKISNMIGKNVDGTEVLGEREKDVIVALVQGMTNKEIADHLCISVNTVITHRRNIARKLQIHSPAGLTIYAIVNNLVDITSVKL